MGEAASRSVDFPKLCKDFQSMGRRIFNGTEIYKEPRDCLTNRERITREVGWKDARRRRIVA